MKFEKINIEDLNNRNELGTIYIAEVSEKAINSYDKLSFVDKESLDQSVGMITGISTEAFKGRIRISNNVEDYVICVKPNIILKGSLPSNGKPTFDSMKASIQKVYNNFQKYIKPDTSSSLFTRIGS